jgi:hypothetical protein
VPSLARLSIVALAPLWAWALCADTNVAAAAGGAQPAGLQTVVAAAAAAQARCHGEIHHDTYAFERCLLSLLESEPEPTPRRLGIEYFGHVGAMNSARLGMMGAEDTAFEFLARFRRTQRQLRIDDRSLCRSVPGDCDVRSARIALMESTPVRARRDRSEEAQHVH